MLIHERTFYLSGKEESGCNQKGQGGDLYYLDAFDSPVQLKDRGKKSIVRYPLFYFFLKIFKSLKTLWSIRYMEEYTTKDLAEVLLSLASVFEDFAEYCELRTDQIIREISKTLSN